jgi:parallel beta-helix repeat protein
MKRSVGASLLLLTIGCPALGADYYVRQTVGNDTHDGLTPATAWKSVSKLSTIVKAGDTAYVGPGLYRGEIVVLQDGSVDQRIVFRADPTGQQTGDPPGPVVITGADPVDEASFEAGSAPGVYRAVVDPVVGMVEMDGDQRRYIKARDTKEFIVDKMPEVDVVAKLPSSFFYDSKTRVLTFHTSDGAPPTSHEIELIRRGNGIAMTGKHGVTVVGFTFRHFGDAGINFFKGSGDGIAIGNTSFGSRQGIRVYAAKDILVYGNTLFRNDNSGAYFAAGSNGGVAIGNVAFENTKGLRWSSASIDAIAADNVLFDNRERGLAIEKSNRAVLRGNVLVNNGVSQLLVIDTAYGSEGNCFDRGTTGRLVADFFYTERFESLESYRKAKRQDLSSREGDCGALPAKLDVHALEREVAAYQERP